MKKRSAPNRLQRNLRSLGLGFFILLLIFFLNQWFENSYQRPANLRLGITFSPLYAQELGLDWQATFESILDDLAIHNLRLPTYWSMVEPTAQLTDFSKVDWMIDQASKRNSRILLVVGGKQPRWPECYYPTWAKSLNKSDQEQALLNYIEKTIDRYKGNPQIWGWQVENEPLFPFGQNCPKADADLLEKEVALVRKLDPNRPVILTESGELRPWQYSMRQADILGTTLYRRVHNPFLGYISWPISPAFYYLKTNLTKQFFAAKSQGTFIAELQAEPWSPIPIQNQPLDKQLSLFSDQDLQGNVQYAIKTRASEIYLWGVEWWYYMAQSSHPEYLKTARSIFDSK